MSGSQQIEPGYVDTGFGEFHFRTIGQGAPLVAVTGLATDATVLACELAERFPHRRVVVIDPPGIGGSADVVFATLKDAQDALRAALVELDLLDSPIMVADLCAALLDPTTPGTWPTPIAVGYQDALGWARADIRPPDLTPREDGSHLNALWVFLRDRGILIPHDPSLPRRELPEYPSTSDLSGAFIAALTNAPAFERIWNMCLDAFRAPSAALEEILNRSDSGNTEGYLSPTSGSAERTDGRRQISAPSHDVLWHDYVRTANGRVHLRRAGREGDPIMVLPTGGGSSAQFAPVITGLAHNRTVIGIDYLGNGLSDKTTGTGSINDLAHEVIATMDALEIPQADIWGSHTGACIGLEISIIAPERVRRLVMEGPVVVSEEFQADLLANYFPDFTPNTLGLHLQHIWHWRRDMFMFWPWYRNRVAAARQLGIPSAADIHLYAVGILESGSTYSRAYRAAFAYPTLERLPLLTVPSIITAGPNDMLANALDDALQAIPADILSVIPTPTTVWWPAPDPDHAEQTMEIYRDFLRTDALT